MDCLSSTPMAFLTQGSRERPSQHARLRKTLVPQDRRGCNSPESIIGGGLAQDQKLSRGLSWEVSPGENSHNSAFMLPILQGEGRGGGDV